MKNCIVLLFILVFILFVWLSYACYCDLAFDASSSAGIIVSTLAAMITLVVGWQILSNIQEREKIREMRAEIDSFKESVNRTIEEETLKASERNRNVILCVALAQMGLNQFLNKDYGNAVRTLFNALLSKDEQDPLQTDARKHAIQMLEEISRLTSDTREEKLIIRAPENDVRNFQIIALSLKNDLLIELTRRIKPLIDGQGH